MDDGSEGNGPKANKKDGRLLVIISAVIVVAVMTIALILASGVLAPRGEDGLQTSDDTSSDASEDELVSGVASDFILNQSDIGADWVSSEFIADIDQVSGYPTNLSVTSAAHIKFEQLNSTGHVHYWVDIVALVFDTVDNASSYYEGRTEIHPQEYAYNRTTMEAIPLYPALLANVSIGDGGALIDGPHITLGHEAKGLYFEHKNVVCLIQYHDGTSYDPLPNELLIDLANKVEAKIA